MQPRIFLYLRGALPVGNFSTWGITKVFQKITIDNWEKKV
mgnify:FL=1